MGREKTTTVRDWGIGTLLERHPGLRVQPQTNGNVILAGDFKLHSRFKNIEIRDTYSIEIGVPDGFPAELPCVREIGGRIPDEFHHYPDGRLCLGSPPRLSLHMGAKPDLPTFVEKCLVPYLFGFSHKERFGKLPFGELKHGHDGIVQDLRSMLKVPDESICVKMLRIGSLQRRKANRHLCPCGSGLRVGRCHSRILNPLRAHFGRIWFRGLHDLIREHGLREKRHVIVRERHRRIEARP